MFVSENRIRYILVHSNYTLIQELLKNMFTMYRPSWVVDTIHLPSEIVIRINANKKYDVVLIDTSYKHFVHYIPYLENLETMKCQIIFMTDENIGELHYYTSNILNCKVINKDMTIEQLVHIIEGDSIEIVDTRRVGGLNMLEKSVLMELAKGHSIDYLCNSQKFTNIEIEQSIRHINAYFGTSHYLEAVYKAYTEKLI
ncbi:hypothetical protein [Lysinibacillus fusiformis]|uniref:hypothetical protein n=1 Tax=Lysinibacillus fusiformis TaxID=28031 RepID=UPI0011AA0FF5|nr:hypothetical protein [Lysinibacillus fusiformis]